MVSSDFCSCYFDPFGLYAYVVLDLIDLILSVSEQLFSCPSTIYEIARLCFPSPSSNRSSAIILYYFQYVVGSVSGLSVLVRWSLHASGPQGFIHSVFPVCFRILWGSSPHHSSSFTVVSWLVFVYLVFHINLSTSLASSRKKKKSQLFLLGLHSIYRLSQKNITS